MADLKWTGLTENTTPVATDIMCICDAPGSSPLSQKMTLATLNTFIKATGGRELISEQTPTGTTVTWSSIPATYRSLEIEWVARSDRAGQTNEALYLYFNNDTTNTNYYYTYGRAMNTTADAGEGDTAQIGWVPGATAPAGSPGIGTIRIPGYADTTFNKLAFSTNSERRITTELGVRNVGVEWESTVAINRVDIITVNGTNFIAGSKFRLYGVY